MATASTWAVAAASPRPAACRRHAASSAAASPSTVPRQPRSGPSARGVAHRNKPPARAASRQPLHTAQNDTVAASLKVRGAPAITKLSPKVPIQYFLSATFSTLALKRTGVLPNLVA